VPHVRKHAATKWEITTGVCKTARHVVKRPYLRTTKNMAEGSNEARVASIGWCIAQFEC